MAESMYEPNGELLRLDTEEKRERWLRFILGSEMQWAECQMVYDEENLVLRVRWPDGEEVAFDCQLRRRMELVLPEEERIKN